MGTDVATLRIPPHLALCLHLTVHLYPLVEFSCSVAPDSLWPHWLEHTRLLFLSPTPRACSNSCPLSQWCQPSYPLLSPSPAFNLSHIRVFSNESVLHIRWPKDWNFSFSISPSNEYSGLISFRMNWFDFLAVHGTLKSLLQHHSSKASILRHSAFFMVLLSHPYTTTGEIIALTRRTFVGKVTSLYPLSYPLLCDKLANVFPWGSWVTLTNSLVPKRGNLWFAAKLDKSCGSFGRSTPCHWPRDRMRVSHIVSRCFTIWATREVLYYVINWQMCFPEVHEPL